MGEVIAPARAVLDLSMPDSIASAVTQARPRFIVNAAAYTRVEEAESEPDIAMKVNGTGPRVLAHEAARAGAALIHYSTDYVFDGESSLPYKPGDSTRPVNVYGESKLAGEIAVRDECPNHLIVRTSWVYSHEGQNFVRTMLKAASEARPLRVVNDQRGCPTSSEDLASALIRAAEVSRERGLTGTFHFCNAGVTTWFDFAREIFGIREIGARLEPISSDEFAAKAKRPRSSVLDCTSFVTTFGVEPRAWQAALKDTMARLS
jgi:dTDP-4-dehydrorhamnose reductase